MRNANGNGEQRDLRLWPGVVAVFVAWVVTFGSGMVAPSTPIQFFGMMIGPILALLIVLVWWLFASRVPWSERLFGMGLIFVFLGAAFILAHPSAKMVVFLYGLPTVVTAFVAWAFLSRGWAPRPRLAAMAAMLLVAAGAWTLVRTRGVDGDMAALFAWRWAPTAEERLLAAEVELEESAVAGLAVTAESEVAWPGFRGADRRGVVPGTRLATDWEASPPEELWRRPVGPGWGSFALVDGRLYTQEQRGEEELVSAYDAETGEPIWYHRDEARFWEALAGAGPRATPTWHEGRLYTLGATGMLNALDAATGARLWSRNLVDDTGAAIPDWGFASSPLLTEGLVIVHAGGPDDKSVVAYDAATGEPRWYAPAGQLSYSSVERVRLAEVDQLLVLTGEGASSLAPADGEVLWTHSWVAPGGGARIVQPALTDDGGLLIGTGFGMGTRRIDVAKDNGGWQIEERWTTRAMKPYYNDFVLHRGHAYGFDGRIMVCLDLETGERAWKGGRYGNGQALLLPDQDLLLVLSDRGEVALVEAKPEGFRELAKMPAIEGKTWNHPVLADGVLYVRNGEEMAAFRLPEG